MRVTPGFDMCDEGVSPSILYNVLSKVFADGLGSTCIRESRRTWRKVKKTECALFRAAFDEFHFTLHRKNAPRDSSHTQTHPDDFCQRCQCAYNGQNGAL